MNGRLKSFKKRSRKTPSQRVKGEPMDSSALAGPAAPYAQMKLLEERAAKADAVVKNLMEEKSSLAAENARLLTLIQGLETKSKQERAPSAPPPMPPPKRTPSQKTRHGPQPSQILGEIPTGTVLHKTSQPNKPSFEEDPNAMLHEEIRRKRTFTNASGRVINPTAKPAANDLMADIRKGVKLKSASERVLKPLENRAEDTAQVDGRELMQAISKALFERRSFIEAGDESFSSGDEWSNDE